MSNPVIITVFSAVLFSCMSLPAQELDSLRLLSFGGLALSPSQVYSMGPELVLKEDTWDSTSYDRNDGYTEGSCYFTHGEMGRYFSSEGKDFTIESGSIDNGGRKVSYDGHDDWRLPTMADWRLIFGKGREGATVNGRRGVHYASVCLDDYRPDGFPTYHGVLVFPDGAVISGRPLRGTDSRSVSWRFTREDIEHYVAQGCAFLPALGQNYGDRGVWNFGGLEVRYLSADHAGGFDIIYLRVDANGELSEGKGSGVFHSFPARLVRDVE